MTMSREELAQLRTEQGLTQGQLAALINGAMDRKYRASDVSGWERGRRTIPEETANVILALAGGPPASSERIESETDPDEPPLRADDLPPGVPEGQTPLVPKGGALEAATIEMFMGIGGGLIIAGNFTGNQAVRIDGEIVQKDSRALGVAYAKLAEQNAWVKRILESMTMGGAWVEVVMVTVTTGGKVVSNHRQYADFVRQQQIAGNGGAAESNGNPLVAEHDPADTLG